MQLLQKQHVRHHYSRCQIKHQPIPANQTPINLDNAFTGAFPDLVIVCLVSDDDHALGYQRNPFNFQTFGVNRIELTSNVTSMPREGNTPNFATKQYYPAYMTFLQEFECDTGD